MADERSVDLNNETLADAPVADSPEVAEVLEVPVAMTAAEIDERAQVVEALRDGAAGEPTRRDPALRDDTLRNDTLREPPLRD
jgi:hypothetical protein